MEGVATMVARLESGGVSFVQHPLHVGFTVRDGVLTSEDIAGLGELILEREDELRSFLDSRGAGFGAFAAVFRSFTCRNRTPAAMLPWLRERAPHLYGDITGRLPDRIQELWEQGAPMEEFKAAVRRLEESHRAALDFYEECRKGSEK